MPAGNPILLDGDNFIKKMIMAAAFDDLKANGTFTGGCFGTINALAPLCSNPQINPAEIYAFFDAGVPAARLKAIPDYKAKRKEKKKALTEDEHEKAMGQMHLTREMLELLGVVCAAYQDREADDVCAASSQLFCDQGRHPIIVSGDKDLMQCVRWGARVWDTNKKVLVSAENFEEVWGIPVRYWLLFRTLTGDTSDEIKGAVGVGEDRAKKIIEWMIEYDMGPVGPEDQLLDVTSILLDKYPTESNEAGFKNLTEDAPAWAVGIIKDLTRLQREMSGIDLSASFGPTTGLVKKLAERPEPQPKAFLQFCNRLHFGSVLSDPDRALNPFRNAAKRRPKQ